MLGSMMDTPLLISSLMDHAEKNFPEREIVSVTADNPDHRYTFQDAFKRTRQLANALQSLGIQLGDRVGTLAWNDHRHFELYYAISCSGAICHTVNPRLFPEQLVYIINHAEDRVIFCDPMFVPLLENIQDQLEFIEHVIVLTSEDHMPSSSLSNLLCYETLIAAESSEYEWPKFDEKTASAMCYTSGTTGNPKGVLYNHRSTILHAYAAALPDVFGISASDCILPIVPMFHVNAWGTIYSGPLCGSKIVLPGSKMGDGETLQRLIESEQVTVSQGVPTVWLALLAYLEESGKQIHSLKRVITGGAACPAVIAKEMQEKHDVYVHVAWGMTEMSPLGTFNQFKPGMEDLEGDELLEAQLKAGRGVYGVEMKITDDENNELPWDGVAFGSLKVRGPWVLSDYFKAEPGATLEEDGWFETGDVATIDKRGFMAITDRTKDVIKSGGEWISSIDLENTATNHPKVTEAAVIGVNHPKWTERPLLLVQAKDGEELSKDEILQWYEGKVAKWWIPDDVVFVDSLPHTATGKIQKFELRKIYKNHQLPDIDT
ncbi:TPA: long-chain fatty acid--CoA ligase [Candidatus Poribacteria bacterium]|nr:long-chain fatty acid--CoA ligase [Candidatus Poribacteria bacterium]|tara:strand:+ start:315 stop:1952 length:1638 start_codon:yes stop_codon:yes gene_type:complete